MRRSPRSRVTMAAGQWRSRSSNRRWGFPGGWATAAIFARPVSSTRWIRIGLAGQIAIDRGRDVDCPRLYPELIDHELSVCKGFRARGAVRHPDSDHILLSQRFRGEKCSDRRVHAAGETDYRFLESAALEFLAQKGDEPPRRQAGIDLERRRAARRLRCTENGNGVGAIQLRSGCLSALWFLS